MAISKARKKEKQKSAGNATRPVAEKERTSAVSSIPGQRKKYKIDEFVGRLQECVVGDANPFQQVAENQQREHREKIIDNHPFYNLSQGKLPRADSSSSFRESDNRFTGKRRLQALQRR